MRILRIYLYVFRQCSEISLFKENQSKSSVKTTERTSWLKMKKLHAASINFISKGMRLARKLVERDTEKRQ